MKGQRGGAGVLLDLELRLLEQSRLDPDAGRVFNLARLLVLDRLSFPKFSIRHVSLPSMLETNAQGYATKDAR